MQSSIIGANPSIKCVCVWCDRFIIQTGELNWIGKNPSYQTKRLMNPDLIRGNLFKLVIGLLMINKKIYCYLQGQEQKCQYMCCLQCYKSLKGDNLDENLL